jgi:hypothetical protein
MNNLTDANILFKLKAGKMQQNGKSIDAEV